MIKIKKVMEKTEEEKIADLLKPRRKVIADFPQGAFKFQVGEILNKKGIHFTGNATSINESEIDKYPHLFKPLEWWEDREENDLPKYLKKISNDLNAVKNGEVITLEDFKWWGFINDKSTWNLFLPATEKDYLEYLTTLKP